MDPTQSHAMDTHMALQAPSMALLMLLTISLSPWAHVITLQVPIMAMGHPIMASGRLHVDRDPTRGLITETSMAVPTSTGQAQQHLIVGPPQALIT